MKKIIFATTLLCTMVLSGCSKFTDIQPKGKNLLTLTEDLEKLLNYNYELFSVKTADLVNAVIYRVNIPDLVSNPIKTLNNAQILWDESIDRIQLTATDAAYSEFYKIIGTRCNPILLLADESTGSKYLINKIKAEAYVLRAWCHYLVVNHYAKAYNPTTADSDGGVVYLLETDLITQPLKKYTVQKVYDFILADIDAAIKSVELADEGVNYMRVGKSFAYAVQAKVLMSMHRYDEALAAANASLTINNHVDDHNSMLFAQANMELPALFRRPSFSSKEDLLAVYTQVMSQTFPPEMINLFDPDAVLINHLPSYLNQGSATDYSMNNIGIPGLHVWASNYNVASFSCFGITTVDMHLTEAECLIRNDQLSQAQAKLELIRKNRILEERYAAYPTTKTKNDLIALLKQLSRCENFYTFKDFIDLKRWNTEPEFAETLTRELLGVTYTLTPNSPLWIYPFPQNATLYNPNLSQNY